MGVLNGRWRVFIDGIAVGFAPRGKTMPFPVSPGAHTVKIWSYRGASCSNEVTLDLAPGTVRSLKCGSNPPPLGITQLPAQIGIIRNVFKDGGVSKGALFLREDAG
jgi:hypothetical protein